MRRTVTSVGGGGDWSCVQRHVQRAIDERFSGSARLAADAAGVDWRTLDKLLRGQPVKRRPPLVRLAAVFGWQPDGFDQALAGQEPTRLDGAAPAATVDERLDAIEGDLAAMRASLSGLRSDLDRVREHLEGDR